MIFGERKSRSSSEHARVREVSDASCVIACPSVPGGCNESNTLNTLAITKRSGKLWKASVTISSPRSF